ncbi:MAG: hypothetical protein ACREMY_24425, partial [bacterium]
SYPEVGWRSFLDGVEKIGPARRLRGCQISRGGNHDLLAPAAGPVETVLVPGSLGLPPGAKGSCVVGDLSRGSSTVSAAGSATFVGAIFIGAMPRSLPVRVEAKDSRAIAIRALPMGLSALNDHAPTRSTSRPKPAAKDRSGENRRAGQRLRDGF